MMDITFTLCEECASRAILDVDYIHQSQLRISICNKCVDNILKVYDEAYPFPDGSKRYKEETKNESKSYN